MFTPPRAVSLIGAPTDVGAGVRGASMGPEALRVADIGPILLFGQRFWEKLIDLDHLVDTGMISPGDVNLIRFVETAEQAWEALADHYGFDAPPTETGAFAEDI